MTQSTLLVIGGGPEQFPAIRKAREMGVRVAVTDRNSAAPGIAEADVQGVVSTGDREGNLECARDLGIAGVMAAGSETAVPVVAHVASRLGLPGFSGDTALAATNKVVIRERFERCGVPTTDSFCVGTPDAGRAAGSDLGLPVVVKPSDSSGHRGVTVVRDASWLPTAV